MEFCLREAESRVDFPLGLHNEGLDDSPKKPPSRSSTYNLDSSFRNFFKVREMLSACLIKWGPLQFSCSLTFIMLLPEHCVGVAVHHFLSYVTRLSAVRTLSISSFSLLWYLHREQINTIVLCSVAFPTVRASFWESLIVNRLLYIQKHPRPLRTWVNK